MAREHAEQHRQQMLQVERGIVVHDTPRSQVWIEKAPSAARVRQQEQHRQRLSSSSPSSLSATRAAAEATAITERARVGAGWRVALKQKGVWPKKGALWGGRVLPAALVVPEAKKRRMSPSFDDASDDDNDADGGGGQHVAVDADAHADAHAHAHDHDHHHQQKRQGEDDNYGFDNALADVDLDRVVAQARLAGDQPSSVTTKVPPRSSAPRAPSSFFGKNAGRHRS